MRIDQTRIFLFETIEALESFLKSSTIIPNPYQSASLVEFALGSKPQIILRKKHLHASQRLK